MYQMKHTLHFKQLRCHISQSPHKSVFERLGACGRCRHDVDIAYTLVPALELEHETAVEGYLNVRDIVLK